jgi:hypothetical protein
MDKNLGIVIIRPAAMAFNVAKVLTVKYACQNVDSRLVVFGEHIAKQALIAGLKALIAGSALFRAML